MLVGGELEGYNMATFVVPATMTAVPKENFGSNHSGFHNDMC